MRAHSLAVTLLMSVALPPSPAIAAEEWLSLGAKNWAPTVVSKTGAGTANAVAEARVMRDAIAGWCGNWAPGDAGCVARELASPAAQQTYRASADCIAGRITPVDGNTYTLAGHWDNSDIGGGRTRWRDANGKIVGRDNASGGLGISQQWEVLCPKKPAARPAPRTQAPAPAAPIASAYVPGDVIYARYGRQWIAGKVVKVRRQGTQLTYEVRLENGARGMLPAHMLRKTP